MQKNKLTIQIEKPISEIFEFTTNPKNTPTWIDSIRVEETSEWPIKVGSSYKNQDTNHKWHEYKVTALKKDKLFELTSKDKNFHVRYSYKSIGGKATEMEYYEWVDNGELDNPFVLKDLEKLKEKLEN